MARRAGARKTEQHRQCRLSCPASESNAAQMQSEGRSAWQVLSGQSKSGEMTI
jgi:hypothetical protein